MIQNYTPTIVSIEKSKFAGAHSTSAMRKIDVSPPRCLSSWLMNVQHERHYDPTCLYRPKLSQEYQITAMYFIVASALGPFRNNDSLLRLEAEMTLEVNKRYMDYQNIDDDGDKEIYWTL